MRFIASSSLDSSSRCSYRRRHVLLVLSPSKSSADPVHGLLLPAYLLQKPWCRREALDDNLISSHSASRLFLAQIPRHAAPAVVEHSDYRASSSRGRLSSDAPQQIPFFLQLKAVIRSSHHPRDSPTSGSSNSVPTTAVQPHSGLRLGLLEQTDKLRVLSKRSSAVEAGRPASYGSTPD